MFYWYFYLSKNNLSISSSIEKVKVVIYEKLNEAFSRKCINPLGQIFLCV